MCHRRVGPEVHRLNKSAKRVRMVILHILMIDVAPFGFFCSIALGKSFSVKAPGPRAHPKRMLPDLLPRLVGAAESKC